MKKLKYFIFHIILSLAVLLLMTLSLQAQNLQKKQLNPSQRTTSKNLVNAHEELAKFEQFVIKAKKLGATHVDVTFNVPPALWQYDVPNDPYPEWYAIQPGLMKIFPNEKIRPYIDIEYAERVVALFQSRCEVLRKHRLKGAWSANEPYVLPEKFFTDHPELRGHALIIPTGQEPRVLPPVWMNQKY